MYVYVRVVLFFFLFCLNNVSRFVFPLVCFLISSVFRLAVWKYPKCCAWSLFCSAGIDRHFSEILCCSFRVYRGWFDERERDNRETRVGKQKRRLHALTSCNYSFNHSRWQLIADHDEWPNHIQWFVFIWIHSYHWIEITNKQSIYYYFFFCRGYT